MKSKKRPKLTRELLLQRPEFWIENIRTELFNMVQEYLDHNNMSRKELAEKLGVSKGYISQVLNGESDHRLSKIVSLATSLGKAPYIYLKDINEVLSNDVNGKSIYIDFEELESKANRCDILDSFAISGNTWNYNNYSKLNIPNFKLEPSIFSSSIFEEEESSMVTKEEDPESVNTLETFANAA